MNATATSPRPAAPVIGGRVPFATPFVLAPMEGVTHRAFRDVVMDLGGVGAAWTEFLRVSSHALKPKALAAQLGAQRPDAPVGVQLMGVDPARTAETAANAVLIGAPMIDLNFGCPAPVVFNKCAGSALLAFPEKVGALVAAVVAASSVPVTAKIRLGVTDASRLREVVAAIESAGAAALTVHARTRADGYTHPARWEHLAAVRSWTKLPLVGNGDVLSPHDAHRMLRETGVDAVMIGRGVLRDPWIFARLKALASGEPEPTPTAADALAFHARYVAAMDRDGFGRGKIGVLKQLWKRVDFGLRLDDAARLRVLRAPDLATLEAELAAAAAREIA